MNDPRFLYQATSYRNLQSIRTNGLDPGHGGNGGAGAQLGAAGTDFVITSQGYIHGTSASSTANFYSLMRDDPPLFGNIHTDIGNPANRLAPHLLADMAIILRFSKKETFDLGVDWERDPHDPRNAFRTRNAIGPDYIEGLTTEGWVKIRFLINLDSALSGR